MRLGVFNKLHVQSVTFGCKEAPLFHYESSGISNDMLT